MAIKSRQMAKENRQMAITNRRMAMKNRLLYLILQNINSDISNASNDTLKQNNSIIRVVSAMAIFIWKQNYNDKLSKFPVDTWWNHRQQRPNERKCIQKNSRPPLLHRPYSIFPTAFACHLESMVYNSSIHSDIVRALYLASPSINRSSHSIAPRFLEGWKMKWVRKFLELSMNFIILIKMT